MEIRISEKAKRQLKNIYNYYSENSIQYTEHPHYELTLINQGITYWVAMS